MCLIYHLKLNLLEIKLKLLKSDVIYYFEPYVVALWSVFLLVFLYSGYPLVESLSKSVSSFRIHTFSLIFNGFRRVNLSSQICLIKLFYKYKFRIYLNVKMIWCWYTVLPGDIFSLFVESYIEFGFWFPNILYLKLLNFLNFFSTIPSYFFFKNMF